ncbi:MAG: TetR/AcrR family transcriptional regulator, partial [Pseudobdellovibrionaceae bacterium]
FLEKALKEFVDHGYANASTTRIVEATGMARGSLYYHFGDKKGLFVEVYRDVLKTMAKAVDRETKKHKDPWLAIRAGADKLIRLCANRRTRRLIIEAYSSMHYEERMVILNETLLGMLVELMKELHEIGYFQDLDLRITTILLYGMISEAGRSFEILGDSPEVVEEVVRHSLLAMDRLGNKGNG